MSVVERLELFPLPVSKVDLGQAGALCHEIPHSLGVDFPCIGVTAVQSLNMFGIIDPIEFVLFTMVGPVAE